MKKARSKEGLFLVEGIKSVEEALAEGVQIEEVFLSQSFIETNIDYEKRFQSKKIPVYVLNDRLFDKASQLKTPQGILCTIKTQKKSLENIIAKKGAIVILDGISDPGNLGTIIRTADAFAFAGVILLPGSADMYNPKTVQAAMGSLNRVDCINLDYKDLILLKENGYYLYGTDLKGNQITGDYAFKSMSAVVIGSEAHGISDKAIKYCDEMIKIAMKGRAESLNAATAAAIIMNMMQ